MTEEKESQGLMDKKAPKGLKYIAGYHIILGSLILIKALQMFIETVRIYSSGGSEISIAVIGIGSFILGE